MTIRQWTALAVCLLIAPAVWAIPITYDVTAERSLEVDGPLTNPLGAFIVATDPIFAPGEVLELSFDYDPETAGIGVTGATLYPGAMSNISATVGSNTITDPLGTVIVNDNGADDALILTADPGINLPLARNFNGFSIQDSGGNTWIAANLRLFFIQGDFLGDESLPGALTGLGSNISRIALDFWDMAPEFGAGGEVINGASARLAFFEVSDISARTVAVDEPPLLALLGLGLAALGISRRKAAAS